MQQSPGILQSFKAGETIPAYRVVYLSAAHTVSLFATSTSYIVGVSQDEKDTGGFVPIATQHGASSKVVCFASVAAGTIVGPATAGSGKVQTVAIATATGGVMTPTLGIALQSGSTDSVIEVLLQPNNGTHV